MEAFALVRAGISLIGLGLLMGFSPTLYALLLHLLSGNRRPWRPVAWLCAGVVLACTVLLTLFHSFDPAVVSGYLRHRVDAVLVHRSVDLTVSALFCLAAVGTVLHWRLRPARPPHPPALPPGSRPMRLLLFGFLDTAVSLAGMATMYICARLIAATTHEPALGVSLYAVFLTGVIGPVLAMTWAWARFTRVSALLARWIRWFTSRDLRLLLAGGLAAAGAVFAWFGLLGYP